MSPECLPDTREKFKRALSGNEGHLRFETAMLHRDGHRVEVELSTSAISFDGGNAALVFLRDITERVRAEQALRTSEERLREAQKMGHLGHWELDGKTRRILWSDEVYRLFHRKPSLGPPGYEENLRFCCRTAARPTTPSASTPSATKTDGS